MIRSNLSVQKIGSGARGLIWPLVAAIILITVGCGLPEHMHVRYGIDPTNQDDDVRFRTNYFFRVFDYNPDANIPQKDSLYRFRMTGKSNSLSSKVRFEAGTLYKSQIDPFGAAIVLDEKSGRFRFVSTEETKRAAEREAAYAEIGDLVTFHMKECDKLNSGVSVTACKEEVFKVIRNGIKNKMNEPTVKNDHEDMLKQLKELSNLLKSGVTEAANKQKSGQKGTAPTRRGFQILGPEGWRTFDQDERLILAMSSSGKPLISAMRELSDKVLNEQPARSEVLLQLTKESLRVSRVEKKLHESEAVVTRFDPNRDVTSGVSVETIFQDILKELDTYNGQPK